CGQYCRSTTAATVIDTSAARGAAISTGTLSASSGTAISASPNPNAERISVAMKMTASTCSKTGYNKSLQTTLGVVTTKTQRPPCLCVYHPRRANLTAASPSEL